MDLSSATSESLIHRVFNNWKTHMMGVAIALFIIFLWALSLGFLLITRSVEHLSIIGKAIAILGQTFLYTGLFITAHDAMHGTISLKRPRINYLIGSLAMLLYGFFSYDRLLKKHMQHHYYPASESDPDFHNGKQKNVVAWYIYFMQGYWSWWQFANLVVTYLSVHLFLHIPHASLMLFWIVPLILSSVQLFYFGTFSPHREPIGGYQNSSRSQSVYLPFFWSFLTCYHFGCYHHEHHLYPNIPWWKLPSTTTLKLLLQDKTTSR